MHSTENGVAISFPELSLKQCSAGGGGGKRMGRQKD